MNQKRLVPALKKKFNYVKPQEVPGWRKLDSDKSEFSIDSKSPALLNDRSDYHRNLVYPHWTLEPLKTESGKHFALASKRNLGLTLLRGKESLLHYESQKEFERVPGQNIVIGSLTCREPANPAMPHRVVLQDPCKNFRIKKSNPLKASPRQRSLNFYQFGSGTNQASAVCESKNIETEMTEPLNRDNRAEENELFAEMLNTSTSRTASAIVFGSKKTLLDVYTSALHSGSAKNTGEAKKLVEDTLGKGVLVRSSQKMKLFLKSSEGKDLNDCSVSSIFRENEDSMASPPMPPINYRRNSVNHCSDTGHSSTLSKEDHLESISTNLTYSNRKSQESIRSQLSIKGKTEARPGKSEIKIIKQVFKAKDKSPPIPTNQKSEKNKDFKLKIKELANIEILDSDDPLLKARSKSVTNHFEIKSLGSSSRGEWRKSKADEKNNEKEENQAGTVVFDIPTVNSQKSSEKSFNKTHKIVKKGKKIDETLEKGEKKEPKVKNSGKKKKPVKNSSKQVDEKKEEILTHTLKVKKEGKKPKTAKPSRKEEVAERILEGYEQTPTNARRASLVLDVIHEKPKLKGKRSSLPDLKPKNSIFLLKPRKSGKPQIIDKQPEPKSEVSSSFQPLEDTSQVDQNESSIKKKSLTLTVRPSYSALRENKEVQDPNKSLVKKSTYGEKSFKSSLSIRTDDLGFDKTWSRSSSIKKNLLVSGAPKAKTVKKRKKNSGSSEELSESEADSYEEQKSFERPKDPKKETILYEINQLEKLKQFQEKFRENNEDEANPVPSEDSNFEKDPSVLESDSENDVSIDFELSELTKSKYFQLNKFAFSPQVIFRFSQKIDTSPQANVNEMEIKEYNIDQENFESFIIKKRFGNSTSAAGTNFKPNNKYLEILDLEQYLPIEVFRQKMKEFEKMRKKDKILQNRGVVVEIIKQPKLSFSGLPAVNSGKAKTCREQKISDEDIIRSGGSLQVKDSLHCSERLYCRIKDIYQLDHLSGINSNSADRLMKSLKASAKILEKISK